MYYKAYKFRIYPNENQRTLINKTLGCTRFVYNYFLNMLKENGYKKANENIRQYTHYLKYAYPFSCTGYPVQREIELILASAMSTVAIK